MTPIVIEDIISIEIKEYMSEWCRKYTKATRNVVRDTLRDKLQKIKNVK